MLVAACWTGTPVSPPIAHHEPPAASADSFVATLEIDAQPGGKRFQGVWLVHAGERWVVDYRANGYWRPFEGLSVRVTGQRWSPDPRAQAIQAPHFRVARLEVADRKQAKRFFAIGPERELSGTFAHKRGDAGTKSEGEDIAYLDAEGQRFEVLGGEAVSGRAIAIVRDVEVNPAWAATRGGPFVWIIATR